MSAETAGPVHVNSNLMHLVQRSREHTQENYSLAVGVMKSISLANAAYVFAMLLASDAPLTLWLPFWLASFLIIVVTFTGASVGSMVSTAELDWRDAIFPFAATVAEFLLFSLLLPRGAELPMLPAWYACFAVQGLSGALGGQLGIHRVRKSHLSGEAARLAAQYIADTSGVTFGALSQFAAFMAVWAAMRWYLLPGFPGIARWQGLLGMVCLLVSAMVLWRLEQVRTRIYESFRVLGAA